MQCCDKNIQTLGGVCVYEDFIISFVFMREYFASEIDSFLALLSPRKNSIENLNAEINKRLRKAAKKTKGCNLKKLRKKVFKRTGKGFLFSRVEVHANKLGKEYTLEPKFRESVYKGSLFFS